MTDEKQKPKWQNIIGGVLILAGIALIIGPIIASANGFQFDTTYGFNLGEGLFIIGLGGVLFGGLMIATTRHIGWIVREGQQRD